MDMDTDFRHLSVAEFQTRFPGRIKIVNEQPQMLGSTPFPPPPLPSYSAVGVANAIKTEDVGIGGEISDSNGNVWCFNTLLLSIASSVYAAGTYLSSISVLSNQIYTQLQMLNATATSINNYLNAINTSNNLIANTAATIEVNTLNTVNYAVVISQQIASVTTTGSGGAGIKTYLV